MLICLFLWRFLWVKGFKVDQHVQLGLYFIRLTISSQVVLRCLAENKGVLLSHNYGYRSISTLMIYISCPYI